MFEPISQPSIPQIPTDFLLSANRQSPVFYRINIEYFMLYHGLRADACSDSILTGLSNNLVNSDVELQRKATQWKTEQTETLSTLALKTSTDIKRQLKLLPVAALRRLPEDINSTKKILAAAPNDHLCHFHLAWLYTNTKNYTLAERHFNVAALQSQAINPPFACFAYRHLAQVRYRLGKYAPALLAIETACLYATSYDPELQLERIRLLARTQRTTQALSHLVSLINKAPYYEIIALRDAEVLDNPTLRRFYDRSKAKHLKSIHQRLVAHWRNDPLHLLNLDKELGQQNSVKSLQNKQREMLLKLSPLLLFDEAVSSKLIFQRSRSIIMRSLNTRKQQYIQRIEGQQQRAGKVHNTGQWMLYSAFICLIALGLSYAVSTVAYQFDYHWPVNLHVQSIFLACITALIVVGVILLHFTPRKLSTLVKQRQRLEALSLRLGMSAG